MVVRSIEPPLIEATRSHSKQPLPSKNSFSFSANSIATMSLKAGAKVGWGLGIVVFRCASFLFHHGFKLYLRRFRKEEYYRVLYGRFLKRFEKDPRDGFNELLNLFNKDRELFKTIILNIFNKMDELGMKKDGKLNETGRAQIISNVEKIFLDLLVSPDVREHRKSLFEMDFRMDEKFQSLETKRKSTEKAAKMLWKESKIFIGSIADLSGLVLQNQDHYVGEGDVEIKLGDFIERLHCIHGFSALTSRADCFEPFMLAVVQTLGNLIHLQRKVDLKKYPEFKALVQKAYELLQKKETKETLFEIVNERFSALIG